MRGALGWVAMLLVASVGSCICVERPKRITADERERLRERILSEPPATMQHAVGANLDNRIELIGYDLQAERDLQERIIPGRAITVTWYWRCIEPLEEGWKLFTHVTDSAGDNRVPADRVGLVREHYPPSAWRKGEVIADEQVLRIPDAFNSKTLTLYVGAWYGPHRLPIVNDAPNDGTGRIRIGPFPVQYDLPTASIPQTTAVVALDGRLDEPEWKTAASLGPFVRTPDGPPVPERVAAWAMWSSRYLYVAFQVTDKAIVSQFTERDSKIYDQDVVEVFLDEDGDGKDYYEFEVSPGGVLFDCHFSERRKGEPKQFNAGEFRAGVTVDGTMNAGVDDEGYTIELQIPFASLAKFKERTPRPGAVWRVNLYVQDMLEVPASPEQGAQIPREAFAWSAPKANDFHEFRRFGEWRFAGPAAPPRLAPARPAAAIREPEPPAGVAVQPETVPAPGVAKEPPGAAAVERPVVGPIEGVPAGATQPRPPRAPETPF